MQNAAPQSNPLPEDLKGTRAGLFYLLGTRDPNTDRNDAVPGSQSDANSMRLHDEKRNNQWNSAISVDNFQFVD